MSYISDRCHSPFCSGISKWATMPPCNIWQRLYCHPLVNRYPSNAQAAMLFLHTARTYLFIVHMHICINWNVGRYGSCIRVFVHLESILAPPRRVQWSIKWNAIAVFRLASSPFKWVIILFAWHISPTWTRASVILPGDNAIWCMICEYWAT